MMTLEDYNCILSEFDKAVISKIAQEYACSTLNVADVYLASSGSISATIERLNMGIRMGIYI